MKAPRLLTRALVTSFITVAIVLAAVFAVLSLRVRDQVRQAVADNLASAQQVFTRVEARRQQDLRASVATLAENPTLKAALDTWVTERASANEQTSKELLATVQREADKIADAGVGGRARGRRPRPPHRRQRRAAGGVVAARRGDRPGHRRQFALRSRRRGRQRHVSRGVGAAAVRRGDDRIARARHRARRAATRASSRTCRAAHAAIIANGAVLASTVSGPAARDLAAYRSSDAIGRDGR